MIPGEGDLARVRDLYDAGLYLQAWREAQKAGPLATWSGVEPRLLGGRLAYNLGAPRLAQSLHMRAWREDRANPYALYFYARIVSDRHGPLAALEFVRPYGDLDGADDVPRADWLALRADLLATYRDFDAADALLTRAESLASDRPWICIERARVLELEDRMNEALAAARRSLELRPWYRPGVAAVAHFLQQLGRDTEALDLLFEADRRLECAALAAQRAGLLTELRRHDDARRAYERFAELSPLLEKQGLEWLNARRADAACYAGSFAEARDLAASVDAPFYRKLSERLKTPDPGGKRVLLDVGFVRQHHDTCAPATLTALCKYWGRPAEHLEIATEICYDGTPAHSERAWAESNGYVAREFTVTWPSAVALLDRGLPFTLTIVEPTFAHMQGMIGYDAHRDALIIRDPSMRCFFEYEAEEFFKRYAFCGPRGMVLIPKQEAARLDGIDLPDAALFDLHHALQSALRVHRREDADEAHARMAAQAPNHRLTIMARFSLAVYDADPVQRLACLDRLLAIHPDADPLQLLKLGSLGELSRRSERLRIFKELSEKEKADPVFWRQYAQELSIDAREDERAVHLLRKSIRARPIDAGGFYILGNILWRQRRFDEALDLFRLAACQEDKNELLSARYFTAARHLKQTETALKLLQDRARRYGRNSGFPARTLSWAYDQLNRGKDVFAALDAALKLRPDDGELLIYAAQAHARRGGFDRADELMISASDKTQKAAWLRAEADIAQLRGELRQALELWRQILDVEPLSVDAHRAVCQLLAETESVQSSRDHIRAACARFPHNYALHQLWIDVSREEPPDVFEPLVRRLVEINPDDAWARRDLAMTLASQERLDEALREATLADALEPASPQSLYVLGRVHTRARRLSEARRAYRQAVRNDADAGFAIYELLASCDAPAECTEALEFVLAELLRQAISGDGLLAYREIARPHLDPDTVLAALHQAHNARPDLWQAWSALVSQLIDMNKLDSALHLARQAVERFPLIPRLWLDLGRVHELRRDPKAEIEALTHALAIEPGNGVAARSLADVYRRDGEFAQAQSILEDAIARVPLDGFNHASLAEILWRKGEKDEAIRRMARVVELEPQNEAAWGTLHDWGRELQRLNLLAELARGLTARRPGDGRAWLNLARALSDPKDVDERFAAIQQALKLNPRDVDTHDFHATLLAQMRRFDDALAACRTPAWGGNVPIELRGRSAWIQAERGRLPEAIQEIQAALKESPDYLWGWSRLADWCRRQKQWDLYHEASTNLVRLSPHDALSYGYLGHATLLFKGPKEAKPILRRAVDLAPDYEFAGRALYELQRDDGEFDDAAKTLAAIRAHLGPRETAVREIELAVRRGDRAAALKTLRGLCFIDDNGERAVSRAAKMMCEAEFFGDVEALLAALVEEPGVQPEAAAAWIEILTSRGRFWRAGRRVTRLLDLGAAGAKAASRYLDALGEARASWRLRWFLWRAGDRLKSDAEVWGTVGFALVSVDGAARAIDWLSDWKTRDGVRPWMILNLALALRDREDDAGSTEVSRAALGMAPDHTSTGHALWVAMEEALEGQTKAAGARLYAIDRDELSPFNQFLHAMTEAMLVMQEATPDRLKEAYAKSREFLTWASNVYPTYNAETATRRAYKRAYARILRDRTPVSATRPGS